MTLKEKYEYLWEKGLFHRRINDQSRWEQIDQLGLDPIFMKTSNRCGIMYDFIPKTNADILFVNLAYKKLTKLNLEK